MEACLSVVSGACEAAVCVCLAMDLKNFLQGVISFFLKDLFYLFVCTSIQGGHRCWIPNPIFCELLNVGCAIRTCVLCNSC